MTLVKKIASGLFVLVFVAMVVGLFIAIITGHYELAKSVALAGIYTEMVNLRVMRT